MIEAFVEKITFTIPTEQIPAAFAALRTEYDPDDEYSDPDLPGLLTRLDVPTMSSPEHIAIGRFDLGLPVDEDRLVDVLAVLAPYATDGSRVVFSSRDVAVDWAHRVANGELYAEVRHDVVVLDGADQAAAASLRAAAAELLDRAAALDLPIALAETCSGTGGLHRWKLVEEGYVCTWSIDVDTSRKVIKVWQDGLSDFSAEGDGERYLECPSCQARRPVPETWEVEFS